MSRNSPSRAQYTIGWISPMSIELIPAIAALDEEYDVENEGGYLYRRGKIGQHYVALVTLSQTGLAAAADAASRMSSVFTNIEIMLVVGIAGGTPSYESETKQIVLGDIVVSMPGPGHGGIFQYDSGAWDRDGRLKVLTHTNSPADRVKNLVNHLRGESISATLPQLLASMRSKIPEEFVNQYLDQILHKEGDRVFPSNYGHVRERELCTSCCEPAKAKQRSDRGAEATRKIDSPRVHYGCIGSTSQLQMSASMRDRLRDSSRQVLAYEMETSGVINTHSALAIRGICDYADSHKNKIWQKYASATAVAYAKVLLQNLPLSDAAKSRSEPVREERRRNPFEITETHTTSFQQSPARFVNRADMLQKITDKCNVTIKSCTVLYLHGVTGCGKSLISRHYAAITTKFSARFELPGKSKLDFKSSLARYAEDIPGLCRPSVLTDLTTSSATGDFEAIRNQQDISINAFLGWLKTEGNDQWFILVDDLQWSDSDEATTHWIQHFISQVNQGTILITSQSPALTRVYPSLKVESLQLEESLSLMEEILGTGGDAVIQANRRELASRLGNHALSINCAAQYMYEQKMDVNSYIHRWEDCDASIFEDSDMSASQTKTVALTLEKLDADAQNLLLLCAFLDPGCIWKDLFPDIPAEMFESLKAKLSKFSLVEEAVIQEHGKPGFAIHPAVHKIVRLLALERDDAEQCINTAFSCVIQALPDELTENALDEQRQLLPHVEQCHKNLSLFTEYDFQFDRKILPGLGELGLVLHQRGQLRDAESFYFQAITSYEKIPAIDHTETDDSPGSEILDNPGPANNAIPCRDPDYYIIVNNYGLIYKERGEVQKADACFDTVRQSVQSNSAETDLGNLPPTIPVINLALCLRQNGQLDRAKMHLEQAKVVYQACAQRGEKEANIQLYKVQQYLGTIHREEMDYYKAKTLLQDAVAGLSSAFDNDSLHVAIARKELGSLYLLQDTPEDLKRAEEYLKAAEHGILSQCKENSRVVIDFHWHQLMLRMAQVRRLRTDREVQQDKVIQDFNNFIMSLEKWSKNDPVTLHAVRTYGKRLLKLGRWDEGETRLLRAIAGYEYIARYKTMPGYGARLDHSMDAAFANKDLADGFLLRARSNTQAVNFQILDQAKKYYLRANQLFEAVQSEFANTFIQTISDRLASIESLEAEPANERYVPKFTEQVVPGRYASDGNEGSEIPPTSQRNLNPPRDPNSSTGDITPKHKKRLNTSSTIMAWLCFTGK